MVSLGRHMTTSSFPHLRVVDGDFLWALVMQRRQLNIKIGTELILPSGKAAECTMIDGDTYYFRYLKTNERLALSRNAIIQMMPERVV